MKIIHLAGVFLLIFISRTRFVSLSLRLSCRLLKNKKA